ncbi:hypothetical protein HTZ97_14960 [Desulfuromonas acetoxidans]|uniref:Membrane protein-like n=1 Tax=Desulfuromonas acetoxidans (strain DSM 684 / 11070) TaxID=281689 RepID=Q1JZ04_DESA6|nr:hypothetical protein [Desulfuromonas acetoxidans]EAT15490.1 membrane protein-like [Desulfuromonas acetoxidans DSM 684]MBF0646676.1 hypothetical protein [Desulfuromonas acetoxidans]NVD25779.1 hypothetical protein [Desulfuromonas acetoxidans]NVE17757.1 hypothetical protein [Desulfuromonas acetoxidans]
MSDGTIVENKSSEKTAKLIYILYLVGIVLGITGIIGVIMAYVYRGDAPVWLRSHYDFQIRTFWIGALYIFVGGLLSAFLIGYLLLLFWLVWLAVRCAKGLKALEEQQAPPNAASWIF